MPPPAASCLPPVRAAACRPFFWTPAHAQGALVKLLTTYLLTATLWARDTRGGSTPVRQTDKSRVGGRACRASILLAPDKCFLGKTPATAAPRKKRRKWGRTSRSGARARKRDVGERAAVRAQRRASRRQLCLAVASRRLGCLGRAGRLHARRTRRRLSGFRARRQPHAVACRRVRRALRACLHSHADLQTQPY